MANIKNRKRLQLIQTIWDVMLYSQHFTFHWELLGLASRIEKSGTGDNNFGKWKGTFRSDRPKWPDRSQWTTFKAGPEYSGRTKPKWSVPFDEPTEFSGLLGWKESALFKVWFSRHPPPPHPIVTKYITLYILKHYNKKYIWRLLKTKKWMPNCHSNSTFDLFGPTLTSFLCFLLMTSIYYSVISITGAT